MSRNISELHPELQKKIADLKQQCTKNGLQFGVSECLRTVSEQDALYAKGRTEPGKIVTNCRGVTYSSMHQWGVAFDFYRNDGKGAYLDMDGFFAQVGELGRSIGLEWGGSWKSLKDKPHFQLPDWGSTAGRLKSQYGSPERFKAQWEDNTSPKIPASNMEVNKQVIRNVQLWLMQYSGSELVLDGVYGRNSRSAMLTAIHKAAEIRSDIVLSDEFYSKIKPVRLGSRGDIVKCLEGLLFVHGYNPQEFQGNCTESVARAIGQFQWDQKLLIDQVAGKNTFKCLIGY